MPGPWLDVSQVILDPMFAEELTIIRRTEQIGANGRATWTPVGIVPKPIGVVTSHSDDRLIRDPDKQYLPKIIRVHTKFRLIGPAQKGDREPDVILWQGDYFTVIKVDNFSRFGAGFMSADCASSDPIDMSPQS